MGGNTVKTPVGLTAEKRMFPSADWVSLVVLSVISEKKHFKQSIVPQCDHNVCFPVRAENGWLVKYLTLVHHPASFMTSLTQTAPPDLHDVTDRLHHTKWQHLQCFSQLNTFIFNKGKEKWSSRLLCLFSVRLISRVLLVFGSPFFFIALR